MFFYVFYVVFLKLFLQFEWLLVQLFQSAISFASIIFFSSNAGKMLTSSLIVAEKGLYSLFIFRENDVIMTYIIIKICVSDGAIKMIILKPEVKISFYGY